MIVNGKDYIANEETSNGAFVIVNLGTLGSDGKFTNGDFEPPCTITNEKPVDVSAVFSNPDYPGYIAITMTEAAEKATVNLTVFLNEGYQLKADSLKVYKTGETGTTVDLTPGAQIPATPPLTFTGFTYTFTMPAYDVTVTAEFEEITALEHGAGDVHDGTVWTSTKTLPTAAGTYYLTDDVELSQTWTVPAGEAVNLCLNGYDITFTGESGSVISVPKDATLNLYDCAATPGQITGGKGGDIWTAGGVNVSGSFTMNGGKICGNATTNFGGGVRIGDTGTFTMNDGEICNNTAGQAGGGVAAYRYQGGATEITCSFTMNDGKIDNNSMTNTGGNSTYGGGGIYVRGGGSSLVMNGGTISGNSISSGHGGGVYAYDGAVFQMKDSVISGNKVNGTSTNEGGGLYLSGIAGAAVIENCKITDNTANYAGGGISSNADLTLKGTEVSGNRANYGGGVSNSGTLKMDSGFICNNTGGDGNYNTGGVYGGGELIVGGTAEISNNKLSDGAASNVYRASGKYITLGTGSNGAAAPASGMLVGVTTQYTNAGSGTFTNNGVLTDTIKQYFSADKTYAYVNLSSGDLECVNLPASTYAVNTSTSGHGAVYASSNKAAKDTVITLTAAPIDPYNAVILTAKDADGNDVKLTKNSNTEYTFAMPAKSVIVTADFKKAVTISTNPTPTGITYGQKLSDSTLSGGAASTDGTFSWKDGDTVPNVSDSGTKDFIVLFTPDDPDYAVTEIPLKLTISKANYADAYSSAANAVASGNLKAKKDCTVEITLPEIPTGASYGTVTNTNTGLYTVDETEKANGKLTVKAVKDFDESTESGATTFTVAVTPDANHNGYDITVTVTPTFKTPVTVSGISMDYPASQSNFIFGDTVGYVGTPSAVVTGTTDSAAVTGWDYTYYETTDGGANWTPLGSAPSALGSYKLVVTAVSDDYVGAQTILFTIDKTIRPGTLPESYNVNVLELSTLSLADLSITGYNAKITTVAAIAGHTGSVLTSPPAISADGLSISWEKLAAPAVSQNDQYKITITSDKWDDFEITLIFSGKTELMITADPENFTYGDNGKTGYTGLSVEDDKLAVSELEFLYESTGSTASYSSANTPTGAGTYALTISVPESNTTYVGSVTVDFTIAKKAITVTAKDTNAYVGDELPVLSEDDFTVSGLIGSDALLTNPSLAYDGDPDMTVEGSYDIIASDADAGTNYRIIYQNGILTVSARTQPSGGYDDDPVITVPVTGDEQTVKVEATVSGNTATVKAIKESELAKVTGGDAVEIDLTGLRRNISAAKIPTETVEKIADNGGMSVNLTTATVTFDQTAAQEISAQAEGNNVQLVVDNIKEVSLNAVQKEAVGKLDAALIIDAYLTSGGKKLCTADMNGFGGGKATVLLPYEIKKNRNASDYSVFYLDENGNLEKLNSIYDETEKCFVFSISHFSNYVVAYNESSAEFCPKDASCPAAKFTDLDVTKWYHDGVHFCVENDLMFGKSKTAFAPNAVITRGEIVAMLWRLEGKPVVNYRMQFKDVESGKYYAEAIRWAASEKIVEGYTAESFGPNDAVTREQLAAILYRYAQKKGDGFTGSWMFLLPFGDSAKISSYANEAAHWCYMKSIILGKDGNVFDPQGKATRAEAACMIQRFCERNEAK